MHTRPANDNGGCAPIAAFRLDLIERLEPRFLLSVGDTIATASPVLGLSHTGRVEIHESIGDEASGDLDVDMFKITLAPGQGIQADIDAALLDNGTPLSDLQANLQIFDANGFFQGFGGSNTDPDTGVFSEDPVLDFTSIDGGDYFLAVSGYPNTAFDPTVAGSGTPGSVGDYHLQLRLNSAPAFTGSAFLSAPAGTITKINILSQVSDGDGDPVQLVSAGYTFGDPADVSVNDNGTADPSDDYIEFHAPAQLAQTYVTVIISDGYSQTQFNLVVDTTGPLASLQPDPIDPDQTSLFVYGSDGDDVIRLTSQRVGTQRQVGVSANGKSLGTFAPTLRIIVDGFHGNDNISVADGVTQQTFLYGSEGNDTLTGNRGDNVLVGQDGNDKLYGGDGRDLLIGGWDADSLDGGGGDDVLIAGAVLPEFFAGENDTSGFANLMSEWTRTDQSYVNRTLHMIQGTGLNFIALTSRQFSGTVSDDDGSSDRLVGGSGDDLFFAAGRGATPDRVVDGRYLELINDMQVIFTHIPSFVSQQSAPGPTSKSTPSEHLIRNVGPSSLTLGPIVTVGDTFETAMPVGPLAHGSKVQVHAAIGDEISGPLDADIFKISLIAGQRLLADVDAQAMDDGSVLSSLYSFMILFDSSENELAYNFGDLDPDTGVYGDPVIGFTAPQTDDYYIVLEPSFFGTTGEYLLQLSLNNPPVGTPINPSVAIHSGAASNIKLSSLLSLSDGDHDPVNVIDVIAQSGAVSLNDNGTPSHSDDFIHYQPSGPGADVLTFVLNDGFERSTVNVNVTVTGAAIVTDPTDSQQNALLVSGTDGKDTIRISPQKVGRRQLVKVNINGRDEGTFDIGTHVIIYGLGGNDDIKVDKGLPVPVIIDGGDGNDQLTVGSGDNTIYGGAGNDILNGGSGNDFLAGDEGNDALFGGDGRDFLGGGAGADSLDGQDGDDILVAGTYGWDQPISQGGQLSDILNEWTRTDQNYRWRAHHILYGDGLAFDAVNPNLLGNGSNGSTSVNDDNQADRVKGGGGTDVFFASGRGHVPDLVVDANDSELVENLPPGFFPNPLSKPSSAAPIVGPIPLNRLAGSSLVPTPVGDTIATASPVSVSHAAKVQLFASLGDEPTGNLDVDMYKISLQAGQNLLADIDAQFLDDGTAFSNLDGELKIFDSNGNVLASSYDNYDPDTGVYSLDPFLAFIAPTTDNYYLAVSGYGNFSFDPNTAGSGFVGSTGDYYLQLSIDNPPVATPITAGGSVGGTVNVPVLSGIFDADGDALRLLNASSTSGPVTINDNGTPDTGDDFLTYHAPSIPGNFEIDFSVTDGLSTAMGQAFVTVSGAALGADPTDPTRTALFVQGTTGNDQIRLTTEKSGRQQVIRVTMNGKSAGTFNPTGLIIVSGDDGNDDIRIDDSIKAMTVVYGSTGNDTIYGGGGNSALFGGDGNDQLFARGGRDLLIGGTGADSLDGGAGDDILIGGPMTNLYESDISTVTDTMREWTRTDQTYEWRVFHLLTGTGLNVYTLGQYGGADDVDVIRGGAGLDLFSLQTNSTPLDRILDVSGDEVEQTL